MQISESLKAALLGGDSTGSLLVNRVSTGFDKYIESIRDLLDNSIPKNTRKAFKNDMNQYLIWWRENAEDGEPLPISEMALAAYIAYMRDSGKSKSTIMRALASISKFHTLQKIENPRDSELVKQVMKGISRTLDTRIKRAKPIGIDKLSTILNQYGSSWIDRRNAAMMALGWAAALRCSEIAAMRIADISDETSDGIIVKIRSSKTDQERMGVDLALPYSEIIEPIVYWKNRLTKLFGTQNGPLFPRFGRSEAWFPKTDVKPALSERAISYIIKGSVALIDLDPADYSPHSLRAGFCTDAARYGVPEHVIQRHSRHVSSDVLRDYIRMGNQWEDNPLPAIFGSFFGSSQNA